MFTAKKRTLFWTLYKLVEFLNKRFRVLNLKSSLFCYIATRRQMVRVPYFWRA